MRRLLLALAIAAVPVTVLAQAPPAAPIPPAAMSLAQQAAVESSRRMQNLAQKWQNVRNAQTGLGDALTHLQDDLQAAINENDKLLKALGDSEAEKQKLQAEIAVLKAPPPAPAPAEPPK
jgi:septal ring factor EnvC (AmiA/AmiB activator)